MCEYIFATPDETISEAQEALLQLRALQKSAIDNMNSLPPASAPGDTRHKVHEGVDASVLESLTNLHVPSPTKEGALDGHTDA
jgi:hypothetical protein